MTYRVSIEKNGLQTHAGTLTGDRPENTVFAYAPEYLAAEGAAPISLSLPLQEAAFSPAQTKNYFDSLLPEGYTRRTVAQWIHADEDDYLTILHALGCECLGALQITAEGETHGASYPAGSPSGRLFAPQTGRLIRLRRIRAAPTKRKLRKADNQKRHLRFGVSKK